MRSIPTAPFALDAAELTLSEGGEGTITLYRLGGTTGRATVLVRYEPVVYANEDQSPNYANALSSGDVTIRVEEKPRARPGTSRWAKLRTRWSRKGPCPCVRAGRTKTGTWY